MATRKGFEPSTSGVTGRRSNQLNYLAIYLPLRSDKDKFIITFTNQFVKYFLWQGQKDSNSRHAVLETAALPTELYPYVVGLRGLEPRTDRL